MNSSGHHNIITKSEYLEVTHANIGNNVNMKQNIGNKIESILYL